MKQSRPNRRLFSKNDIYQREICSIIKIPKIVTVFSAYIPIDFCDNPVYNICAGRDALYTCVTELTFKRHVMSSVIGPPVAVFFIYGGDYEYICIFR